MTTRTNSAKWMGTRWQINVQKDGQRKSFYSSKPAAPASARPTPRPTSG